MGGVVSGEARTEDGDDEAVDDAEAAGPPVAAVDLGLLHNQVNDGGHPERCGALRAFCKRSDIRTLYCKLTKASLAQHQDCSRVQNKGRILTKAKAPIKPCTAQQQSQKQLATISEELARKEAIDRT